MFVGSVVPVVVFCVNSAESNLLSMQGWRFAVLCNFRACA